MDRMFAECWAKNVSLSGFLRSYSCLHVFSCSKLFFQKDKMAWSEAQKYAQACNQYNSIGPNVRHNKTRQDERRDKTKTSSKREITRAIKYLIYNRLRLRSRSHASAHPKWSLNCSSEFQCAAVANAFRMAFRERASSHLI